MLLICSCVGVNEEQHCKVLPIIEIKLELKLKEKELSEDRGKRLFIYHCVVIDRIQ